MAQQIPVDERAVAPTIDDGPAAQVAADIAYQRLGLANVAYIGERSGPWVLVDAGLAGTAERIKDAAAQRFGAAPPAAILLTHGHFDHVGALDALAKEWGAPIYAHPLEHPFLTGVSDYPKPDPTVGGGLVALIASLYPNGPIDVSPWLRPLPEDGGVPELPGWRWLLTPGHAPGHVSFWREADRTLIAGDAFITTAQESAYAVVTGAPELHGPPMYYTPDWVAAGASVRKLAALAPELAVTGHGRPMAGALMRQALNALAERFEEVAVPANRRGA